MQDHEQHVDDLDADKGQQDAADAVNEHVPPQRLGGADRTELRAASHALLHMQVNALVFGTLFANRIMLDANAEMNGHEPCTRRIGERRMTEA